MLNRLKMAVFSIVLVLPFLCNSSLALAVTHPDKTGDISQEWKYVEVETQLGPNEEEDLASKTPPLSEEQVKELESISLEILNLRKQLIDKYVEFGVIEKERAEKMKEHFDLRFQKMKDAGFLPDWDKFHKKDHNHDDKQD